MPQAFVGLTDGRVAMFRSSDGVVTRYLTRPAQANERIGEVTITSDGETAYFVRHGNPDQCLGDIRAVEVFGTDAGERAPFDVPDGYAADQLAISGNSGSLAYTLTRCKDGLHKLVVRNRDTDAERSWTAPADADYSVADVSLDDHGSAAGLILRAQCIDWCGEEATDTAVLDLADRSQSLKAMKALPQDQAAQCATTAISLLEDKSVVVACSTHYSDPPSMNGERPPTVTTLRRWPLDGTDHVLYQLPADASVDSLDYDKTSAYVLMATYQAVYRWTAGTAAKQLATGVSAPNW